MGKRKNVVSVDYKNTKVYYKKDKKTDYDYEVSSSMFLIGVIIYI